jgi:cyanate lyase
VSEQSGINDRQSGINDRQSKLNATTDDVVDKMVRGLAATKKVIIALVILAMISLGTVGYLLDRNITHPTANALTKAEQNEQAYVQAQLQHECQALELLTATPVPKPADPAKNPSRETTYQFYEALLFWEHADGCTYVSVPVAHG